MEKLRNIAAILNPIAFLALALVIWIKASSLGDQGGARVLSTELVKLNEAIRDGSGTINVKLSGGAIDKINNIEWPDIIHVAGSDNPLKLQLPVIVQISGGVESHVDGDINTHPHQF